MPTSNTVGRPPQPPPCRVCISPELDLSGQREPVKPCPGPSCTDPFLHFTSRLLKSGSRERSKYAVVLLGSRLFRSRAPSWLLPYRMFVLRGRPAALQPCRSHHMKHALSVALRLHHPCCIDFHGWRMSSHLSTLQLLSGVRGPMKPRSAPCNMRTIELLLCCLHLLHEVHRPRISRLLLSHPRRWRPRPSRLAAQSLLQAPRRPTPHRRLPPTPQLIHGKEQRTSVPWWTSRPSTCSHRRRWRLA